MLRQVSIGVGALLLAAVDQWNTQCEGHSAHFRTQLDALIRGTSIAGMAAAGTAAWIGTPKKHPPRHIAVDPYVWPGVANGKAYLAIHHNETQPTNVRRAAFCKQDSETLDLVGDPTHCELTWDYDPMQTHITHIWISAPGVDWPPIEVPMDKAQAQYQTWRKRRMKWLPGTGAGQQGAATYPLPAQQQADDLRTGIAVKPRDDGDAQDAQ
ncbi:MULTISPECIES: hypothetical protein [Gordonia]|uniref:Uncharacterized protein n=1 Tax=Gordonia aichiensis NBRC 108223 TaxID=1220583 RepID=L7KR26_9ACTN|nr:hypothetical protein [Gordonia aichiensis]GAC51054.1 hypothetical protein GOACH_39_00120 [Gordonia aichiensis NBRC 108223]